MDALRYSPSICMYPEILLRLRPNAAGWSARLRSVGNKLVVTRSVMLDARLHEDFIERSLISRLGHPVSLMTVGTTPPPVTAFFF